MSKFLVVDMPDNTSWQIPAEIIAKDRAAYFAEWDGLMMTILIVGFSIHNSNDTSYQFLLDGGK